MQLEIIDDIMQPLTFRFNLIKRRKKIKNKMLKNLLLNNKENYKNKIGQYLFLGSKIYSKFFVGFL